MSLAAAAALIALIAPAADRWTPAPGTRAYHFESVDHVPSQPDRGYRMDFDLETAADGTITAVVRSAAASEAGAWTEAKVDDACRAEMHAGPGELARVRLFPIDDAAAEKLDARFVPLCAPREVFTPLADVLIAVQIQAAPRFGLAKLSAPGDSARFGAFATDVDRFDNAISVRAPGGTIRFVALEGRRASIDWSPDPMPLTARIRNAIPGREIGLAGTQRTVIRLEIDRDTGALAGMKFTTAEINGVLDVPDSPPIPMRFTREASIVPKGET